MKERLLSLLGDCNLTPVMAAQATGLSESYISQLMADENFAAEVVARRSARLTKYAEHDATIDDLESKALARVKETIPFMKPGEALNAFVKLNAAHRRSAVVAQTAAPAMVVEIDLPEAAHVHFRISAGTNEVLEVEGRSMATLPASAVTKMLRAQTAEKIQALESSANVPNAHVLPALPSALRRRPPIEDQI